MVTEKKRYKNTKYNKQKNEVLSVLKTGVTQRKATEIVGIDEATLYKWKGEYPDFKAQIEAIKHDLGVKALGVTVRHIEKTDESGLPSDSAAKSAQWLLENVHSDVISKKTQVEHTGQFTLSSLIDEAKVIDVDSEEIE